MTNQPCNAGFDGASGLKRHEEIAHGVARFFCANCVIPFAFNPDGSPLHPGFSTNQQLQSHIRKEHTNTVCIFCDKHCSNERQLQIHIESQHSGIQLEDRKNIECTYPDCDKTFTKRSNLTIHIRTVHMGERFVCGEFDTSTSSGLEGFEPESGCGMDFTSKQYLENHIRVAHLGQQLPSTKRPTRVKQEANDLADFIDDEDDDTYQPRSRKTKRKAKYSVLQKMTGDRSAAQPATNLDPSLEFAPDTAISQDPILDQAPENIPSFWESAATFDPNENVPQLIDKALTEPLDNIDWQFQQQAIEGGPFWVGDSNAFDATNYDLMWSQDEREMRTLIGDGS